MLRHVCSSVYSSLLYLYSISFFPFSDFGHWFCVVSWLYYLLSSLSKMVRCNQIKTVCWFSLSINFSLSVLLMFFSFSSSCLSFLFSPTPGAFHHDLSHLRLSSGWFSRVPIRFFTTSPFSASSLLLHCPQVICLFSHCIFYSAITPSITLKFVGIFIFYYWLRLT